MKKIILTALAVAGAATAAYSQGVVAFDDEFTPGYVVIDTNGYASSSTADYVAASDFTAALYSLPGNTNNLNALANQPNQYGYLTLSQFNADGFSLVGTTPGGSGNSVPAGDGYFSGGTMTLSGGTTGSYDVGTSTYTSFDVLALVVWTGTYANLSAALTAGADVGIFAFVNPIGAGGSDPNIPELTGWPTTLSPANTANDGYPELILAPVPEPTTLAIAAMGGLSLLGLRRKKS